MITFSTTTFFDPFGDGKSVKTYVKNWVNYITN